MKASIVDLRYRMNDVIKALARHEPVEVLYHNKQIGTIIPTKNNAPNERVQAHPFFGMAAHEHTTVENMVHNLRGGRYVI